MSMSCILAAALAVTAAAPDGKQILDVDDVHRGKSRKEGSMPSTPRTRPGPSSEVLEQRGAEPLMRILEPKKEAGTATLKVDKNIWNYLPKVDRTIKVPSSMMGGSWMGSHFTNDDLVRTAAWPRTSPTPSPSPARATGAR